MHAANVFLVRMMRLRSSRRIPFDFAGGVEQKGCTTGRRCCVWFHQSPFQQQIRQHSVLVVAASQMAGSNNCVMQVFQKFIAGGAITDQRPKF